MYYCGFLWFVVDFFILRSFVDVILANSIYFICLFYYFDVTVEDLFCQR